MIDDLYRDNWFSRLDNCSSVENKILAVKEMLLIIESYLLSSEKDNAIKWKEALRNKQYDLNKIM